MLFRREPRSRVAQRPRERGRQPVQCIGQQNEEPGHDRAYVSVGAAPVLPRVSTDVDAVPHLCDEQPQQESDSHIACQDEGKRKREQQQVGVPHELQQHICAARDANQQRNAGDFQIVRIRQNTSVVPLAKSGLTSV